MPAEPCPQRPLSRLAVARLAEWCIHAGVLGIASLPGSLASWHLVQHMHGVERAPRVMHGSAAALMQMQGGASADEAGQAARKAFCAIRDCELPTATTHARVMERWIEIGTGPSHITPRWGI